MRTHPTESEFKYDWLDGENLFYRKADKPLYLKAVGAVENEDKSLIVIGDEGVLDHYCRMLISRLKDNPLFKLEVFLSTSKDGLLKRFNQMLSNLSIDEARQPPTPNTAVQLLVINDAGAIKDQEWALLTRLIRDFPGANVRCAMFVDKASSLELEGKIEKLGRKVHKWLVHAPTLDEVSDLKLVGDTLGKKLEVEKLLKLAGLYSEEEKIEIRGEEKLDAVIDIESDSLDADLSRQPQLDEIKKNKKSENENDTHQKNKSSSGSGRLLGLLFVFSITLALMNFLYPDRIRNLIFQLESSILFFDKYVSDQVSIKEETLQLDNDLAVEPSPIRSLKLELFETVSSTDIVIRSDRPFEETDYLINEEGGTIVIEFLFSQIDLSSVTSVTEIDHIELNSITLEEADNRSILSIYHKLERDFLLEKDDVKLTLSFAKTLQETSINTEQDSPSQEANKNLESTAVNIENVEQEVASINSEGILISEQSDQVEIEENNLLRSSTNIILNSQDTTVFLQHIVFTDVNQAIAYIESYSGLEAALVVPISSGNRELIAVLSGPFVNGETAQNWAKNFDFGADYWIRSAGSLKNVISISSD